MTPNRTFTIRISTNQEKVVQRCSVKKVFLEISQNSQKNFSPGVSILIKQTPTQVFL